MDGVTAYALSKSYTDESLDGVGALKGVPCTVKSKTAIDGGTRLVLGWTSNSGVESETIVDMMNGIDGKDGSNATDEQVSQAVEDYMESHFIDGNEVSY